MKKAILIALSAMMVLMVGCDQPQTAEETSVLSSVSQEQSVVVSGGSEVPIIAKNVDDVCEIIKTARQKIESDSNYHDRCKISEITEFYIPTCEFEGFVLYGVHLYTGGMVFHYVPKYRKDDEGLTIERNRDIVVTIYRKADFSQDPYEWMDVDFPKTMPSQERPRNAYDNELVQVYSDASAQE